MNVSDHRQEVFIPLGCERAPNSGAGSVAFARHAPHALQAATLKAAAERAAKDKDSGAFLFPCETDVTRPLPGIQSAHARALRESKVAHFRPYDCRHTWATRAVEAGIDLVTLAAMLGHSKINMVLRSAHPTQEHQSKAMDKMEQVCQRTEDGSC